MIYLTTKILFIDKQAKLDQTKQAHLNIITHFHLHTPLLILKTPYFSHTVIHTRLQIYREIYIDMKTIARVFCFRGRSYAEPSLVIKWKL